MPLAAIPTTYGPKTIHDHTCTSCGHRWTHEKPFTLHLPTVQGEAVYNAAHMCPSCGTGPYLYTMQSRTEQSWEDLEILRVDAAVLRSFPAVAHERGYTDAQVEELVQLTVVALMMASLVEDIERE